MRYISDYIANKGIDTITNTAVTLFGNEGVWRQVEQQRDVYDGRKDITNVLDEEQIEAREKGKPFVPNMERAREHGVGVLNFGIGHRLKGAYACYKAGDEMECVRHILLALDSVCCAIGWTKASAYFNEQNRILYDMKNAGEAARIAIESHSQKQ